MKNNKKAPEISNENFLSCILEIISVTSEQQLAEWQSIIDDEMKKPITKRDYKTILICMFEKTKFKCKRKNKNSDNLILKTRIVKTLESIRSNKSEQ